MKILQHKLCICGSGKKYKQCCAQRTLWMIDLSEGPLISVGTFANRSEKLARLLVFSSKERATTYIANTDPRLIDHCKLIFYTLFHFVDGVMYQAISDHIAGVLIDSTHAQYGKGVYQPFWTPAAQPPPRTHLGFKAFDFPFKHFSNTLSLDQDKSWFEAHPDRIHRVRNPLQEELADPDCEEDSTILVVQLKQGKVSRGISYETGDYTFWENRAKIIREKIITVDPQTTLFVDALQGFMKVKNKQNGHLYREPPALSKTVFDGTTQQELEE